VLRRRLVAVLGGSAALGDHLAANPADWRLLTGPPGLPDLLRVVGADPADPPTGTRGSPAGGAGEEVVADLRLAYRRHLLVLAARDLRSASTRSARLGRAADRTVGWLAVSGGAATGCRGAR
jgi:glutamate-ammonia-ligase adenylyltransferase